MSLPIEQWTSPTVALPWHNVKKLNQKFSIICAESDWPKTAEPRMLELKFWSLPYPKAGELWILPQFFTSRPELFTHLFLS